MNIRNAKKRAFTLVELLLVVTIIGVLAGMVMLNFGGQSLKAQITTAKADIQSLETAISMYEMDIGDYPSNDDGLTALYKDPGYESWKGPYLKRTVIRDPWDNKYIYYNPGDKGIQYDLFSLGKDGQEGSEDDIGNWDEEEF